MKQAAALPVSGWLQAARAVLLLLAVLWTAKFVWSVVVFSHAAGEVCTASLQECRDRQQLTPADIASLQADGVSIQQYTLVQVGYRIVMLFSLGTIGSFQGLLAYQYPQAAYFLNLIQFPAYLSLPLFFYSFPTGKVALRRKIQEMIDWRFYRQKYDTEKALAGFAVTASRETDLELLASATLYVAQQTIQPRQMSLWMRPRMEHKPESQE